MVTAAPATTAPEGSFTTPLIVPELPDCAKRTPECRKTPKLKSKNSRNTKFLCMSPPSPQKGPSHVGRFGCVDRAANKSGGADLKSTSKRDQHNEPISFCGLENYADGGPREERRGTTTSGAGSKESFTPSRLTTSA